MHFGTKSYLKSTRNHTAKHAFTGFGRHGHVARHGARGGVFEKFIFFSFKFYFFYLL